MHNNTRYYLTIAFTFLSPLPTYACGLTGHVKVGDHIEGYCDTDKNKGEKLICEKTSKHIWWCDGPKYRWGNTLINAASKACECKTALKSDIANKTKDTTTFVGKQ